MASHHGYIYQRIAGSERYAVGIVVKNAIVLVRLYEPDEERGMELYDAVAISGRLKTKAVFMTTMTTILGIYLWP